MIKRLLFTMVFFLQINATDLEETNALHAEIALHKNPNVTLETHPVLYKMVEGSAATIKVAMPKYITIYGAEYATVDKNGVVRRNENELGAYVDLLGDLYICHEILETASYEEIDGIIAVALAEKSINKPKKLVLTGVTTFGITLLLICILNKKYELRLGSLFGEIINERDYRGRESMLEGIVFLLITPSLIITKLFSNNLQKKIDLKAAQFTNPHNIVNGLKRILRTKESYFKENVLSRIASALKLKSFFNFIFYPIRAFTLEERIGYLEKEACQV
jgi:hypothetical protein